MPREKMDRNKFLRGEPRPTSNFCPKCGERITWVTKDKCPCELELGWVVRETVADTIINPAVYTLGQPEYVGLMPTRTDLPIEVINDQGLTPDRISLGPLSVVADPAIGWNEINRRRFVPMQNSQAEAQMMERDRYQEQAQRLNSRGPHSQWLNSQLNHIQYGFAPSGTSNAT